MQIKHVPFNIKLLAGGIRFSVSHVFKASYSVYFFKAFLSKYQNIVNLPLSFLFDNATSMGDYFMFR
jgi:hypothetical protein